MELRPRAQAAGNLSGPDEVEVLQTDVMRFMAILGFCLTVIFTLGQDLPVAPAEPAMEKGSADPGGAGPAGVHGGPARRGSGRPSGSWRGPGAKTGARRSGRQGAIP